MRFPPRLIDVVGMSLLTFLMFIALGSLATSAYIFGVPGSNFFAQKVGDVIYGNIPALIITSIAIVAMSTYGIEKTFKTPRRKIYLYGIVFVIVIIFIGTILAYAAACIVCPGSCSAVGASMQGCGARANLLPPFTEIYCTCIK